MQRDAKVDVVKTPTPVQRPVEAAPHQCGLWRIDGVGLISVSIAAASTRALHPATMPAMMRPATGTILGTTPWNASTAGSRCKVAPACD
mmetsp:Transcript_72390/g.121540  ORF Transcript_72390/g.121540 Transcript_72390/m.121540 type:complete len:89 (-) Transcript_72390:1355-1621(-)